jgi:hypothetical protein
VKRTSVWIGRQPPQSRCRQMIGQTLDGDRPAIAER